MNTELGRKERNKLLHEFLNFGEIMLQVGAEIKRVEDTLSRMGIAYGAEKMNVLVITTSIIITMTFPDGQVLTQTRRIINESATDFTKLEELNMLSRSCCEKPLPIEEFEERLRRIQEEAPTVQWYLGSILIAGSFAIFFGGSFLDGVCAAIFALSICLLQKNFKKFCPNLVIFNILCSLTVGIGICLTAKLYPALHLDKIMIGDIMLLIPGIVMTNAIRDIIVGDTISGVMKLIESLLWACSIACGFMLAIRLIGG